MNRRSHPRVKCRLCETEYLDFGRLCVFLSDFAESKDAIESCQEQLKCDVWARGRVGPPSPSEDRFVPVSQKHKSVNVTSRSHIFRDLNISNTFLFFKQKLLVEFNSNKTRETKISASTLTAEWLLKKLKPSG